jgi:hypothetical protein
MALHQGFDETFGESVTWNREYLFLCHRFPQNLPIRARITAGFTNAAGGAFKGIRGE